MATYLQGVTDYIPQYQPFQPDLNFYGNIMQTKQTQYDTNWKALNKMYGQYYNADLTRDDNTEKRDSYLKNIEFQLKRVSQLDLSLEQNVEQATQVFKPFYEDKGLVKDMAWTKNKNNQLARGEMYRLSSDPNDRKQYWAEGIRGVQYLTEEFKNATAEEALGFQNAEYVPFVNVVEKGMEIAEKANLEIEVPSFSPDGRYIIKTKNGEALLEPLKDLFEAQLGSDPAVQAVFKMQAYVDRKDYAMANAAQFNGDANAAEMKYLEDSFNVLKEQSNQRYIALRDKSDVYKSTIADFESQIANGTASPQIKLALSQAKMNKEVVDKVLIRAKEQNDLMTSDQVNSLTGKTEFVNPYGDIKSLRYKVDNGIASLLMQKKLSEAAQGYVSTHMKQTIEADPYGILRQKQQDNMALMSMRERSAARIAEYNRQTVISKQKVDSGTHQWDANGNAVPVDNQFYVRTEDVGSGASTDKVNMKSVSRSTSQMTKEEYLDPYMNATFEVLGSALADNKITKQQVAQILGYDKNKNITLQQFADKYNKYGDTWLRKYVGEKGIKQIHGKMEKWINQNSQLSMFIDNGQKTALYQKYRQANLKVDDYNMFLEVDGKWRQQTSKNVENQLKQQGFKGAFLLYDERGELRSEAEFYEALKKHNIGDYKKLAAADKKRENDFYRDPKTGVVQTKRGPASKLAESISLFKHLPEEYNYKKMVDAAGKAYMERKTTQNIPFARLTTITDPGTGLSSVKASTITVNPLGISPGKAYFGDAVADLYNFDFNGNTDRVTLAGIGKASYDASNKERNQIGKRILDDIVKAMSTPKSGLGKFDLTVSPIAAGSSTKGAIIIKPDAAWLKKYVSTSDKTQNNLLTQQQYNYILKNGISYIMDNKKMKNAMYKQSFQSPLQSYIESSKNGYVMTNIGGDPMKSLRITKNTLGTGDYVTTITYPLYNPTTKTFKQEQYTSYVGFMGANIDYHKDEILTNFFDEVDIANTLNNNLQD